MFVLHVLSIVAMHFLLVNGQILFNEDFHSFAHRKKYHSCSSSLASFC